MTSRSSLLDIAFKVTPKALFELECDLESTTQLGRSLVSLARAPSIL